MYFNTIIWEYSVNLIEVILFFIFIQARLHLSHTIKNIKSKQFIFLFIRFSILCILNQCHISSIITVSVSCILEILFALIFFQDSIIMRIFWGSMFSVICMIAEYIPFMVLKTILRHRFSDILFEGALRVPFTILYLALIAVFVFLLRFLSDRNISFHPLQKISYIIISFSGIIVSHYILYITWECEESFANSQFSFKLILINLFFNVLFIYLLAYIYRLGVSNTRNIKLLKEQKVHELEDLEYQNLLKSTSALREIKHDMELHLTTIQSLASNQKFSEMLSYLKEYHHSLSDTHNLLSTGDTAIDCIVSSKIEIAERLGIATDYSILLPKKLPLETLSLSSLLGNLWNNAIEASCRMTKQTPDEKAFIRFYIKPFHDMVILHIENRYNGILNQTPDGIFLSAKSESTHGIGIKRITDIVKQADGIIHIQTENHIFSVHILLPLKENSDENDNDNS